MLQEVIYCIAEWCQVVLDHIPYKFVINVKIAMCNVITHAFNSFPRNFRTKLK